MSTLTVIVMIIAIGLSGCSTPSGKDWTVWRGTRADGISHETGWNPAALEGASKILWRTNVGYGHSSVVVQKHRLYTMGTFEYVSDADTTYEDVIICLDARSGDKLWRFGFETKPLPHLGPRSTPVLDDNRLYAVNGTGTLQCLHAKSGRVIWRRGVLADSLTQSHMWGIVSSPVIYKKLVLLNIARHGVAFDKMSGKVLWRSPLAENGISTPTLFRSQGEDVVAMVGVDSLYAVNPETGTIRWTYPWHSFTDPVVVGKRLYLTGNLLRSTGYRSVLLDVSGVRPTPVAGSRKLFANTFSTCVVMDGHAYGFDDIRLRGPFRCVNIETGTVVWSEELNLYGALMAADDKLIILKGSGELVIAVASVEGFRPISSAKVLAQGEYEDYPENRRNWCWTAPVLSHGRIYLRNSYGDLACVDVR